MRGLGLDIERIKRALTMPSPDAETGTFDEVPTPWLRNTALVCSEEQIMAVQNHPAEEQIPSIVQYREEYYAGFGIYPHGLHYIPVTGAVWFPPSEDANADFE